MTVYNESIVETADASDVIKGTAFYWHPPDHSKHLELRSIHDVLTDREVVSDPTMSHELLRSQKPPKRC